MDSRLSRMNSMLWIFMVTIFIIRYCSCPVMDYIGHGMHYIGFVVVVSITIYMKGYGFENIVHEVFEKGVREKFSGELYGVICVSVIYYDSG